MDRILPVRQPSQNHSSVSGRPKHSPSTGFVGQRIVKLPVDVIQTAAQRPLTKMLLPASAGFYPKAAGHHAERPHGTNEVIFIYCAAGQGWCEIEGERHAAKAGQMLVLPAQHAHSYGASETDPWSIRWFHAIGQQLPDYLYALGTSVANPLVFLGEDPLLDTLFEEMLTELESGYTALNLVYVSQALAHLLGAMIRRRHTNWIGSPDPRQKIVRSIEMMRTHLDRPLRMAQLAAMVNISAAHFTDLFRTQTGFAPKDYFTRLKMHKACQLLDGTDLPVKEIAHQVGYDDPLHFSRVFKQINALSPTDQRKRNKV